MKIFLPFMFIADRIFLLLFMIGISGHSAEGNLRITSLGIPSRVLKGTSALLTCEFELGNDDLYWVKWFKNGAEFFRYRPDEEPSFQYFPVRGLNLVMSRSNKTAVFLRNISHQSTGRYSCEITTGPPSFSSVNMEKHMKVIDPPHITYMRVPSRAVTGGNAALMCEYDVGSEDLESVKWYMNDSEFFRYLPRAEPYFKHFLRGELDVDLLLSNETTVFLRNLRLQNSGNYTCKVSTDKPHFRQVEETKYMAVIVSAQEIRIVSPRRPLSAGEELEVVCVTFGSTPPATLSWWIGDECLTASARETVSDDSNSTTSRLVFLPTSEEHGKSLTCKAHNPETPEVVLEDSWELNIYFTPQLSIALGAGLETIHEGSDTYFVCNIRANPPVSKVEWRFQSKPLEHQPSIGIIARNNFLVLQRVGRRNRGAYSCMASNEVGEGVSEEIVITVLSPPVCMSEQTHVYGVAENEEVIITCEVHAYPDDVSFIWIFNNSSETTDLITFNSSGTRSIASYIPRSKMDYGTLSCWGRNRIGAQSQPCVFSIVPLDSENVKVQPWMYIWGILSYFHF